MRGRAGHHAARATLAAVAISQVLGFSAGSARAQPTEPTPETAQLSAERLAAQAYDLHAAGKYAEAITAYLKAYEVSNAGVALLNIATIYDRKLHERDLAAEYYRRYLNGSDAEPDLIGRATARLTVLKHEEEAEEQARRATELAAAAPPPALVAPPARAVAPPVLPSARAAPREAEGRGGTPWRTAGFVVGGAGVVGISTSFILGALAMANNRAANVMCDGDACRTAAGVGLAQNAGRLATASTAFFFAGLALAGGGLTLVLAAPKGSSAASRRVAALAVSAQLGASFGGLSVHGGF